MKFITFRYLKFSVLQIILTLFCNVLFADAGKVILLLGTSTAGKTTIIEQLKNIHPDALDFGIDRAAKLEYQELIKELALDEYKILVQYNPSEKIVDLLNGDIRWINKGLSEIQLDEIRMAIKNIGEKSKTLPQSFRNRFMSRIYDRILRAAQGGKTVLTDLVDSKSFEGFNAQKRSTPVYTFLTYCSLNELSRRMQKRNRDAEEKGDVTNKRIGFPLMQFAELYRKRTDDLEPLLGSLKREDVNQAFELHYPDDPSKKIQFLEAFGFSSPEIDEIEITTRFDLADATVVNTAHPTGGIVATIESESSQTEKQFLSTYKALHLGGQETLESRMIKGTIQAVGKR